MVTCISDLNLCKVKKCLKILLYYLLTIAYVQSKDSWLLEEVSNLAQILYWNVKYIKLFHKSHLSCVSERILLQCFHVWYCSCFPTTQKYNVDNIKCCVYPQSMWNKMVASKVFFLWDKNTWITWKWGQWKAARKENFFSYVRRSATQSHFFSTILLRTDSGRNTSTVKES